MPRECLSALKVGRISGPAVESIGTDSKRVRLYSVRRTFFVTFKCLIASSSCSGINARYSTDRAVDVSSTRAAPQQAYHFIYSVPQHCRDKDLFGVMIDIITS